MKKYFTKYNNMHKFLLVISGILIFDQYTKYLIYDYFTSNDEIISVMPFLNFILVWNYGISFGMLNSITGGQVIFSTLALFIIIILIFWYRKTKNAQLIMPISLIIGGAIGNIIDRINYGAVLDFIDVHAFGWHYPAFNIADAFIVLGAIICFSIKKI